MPIFKNTKKKLENGSFIGGGAKSLFKDVTMMKNLVFSVKLTIYGLGERPFCLWEVRDTLIYIFSFHWLMAPVLYIIQVYDDRFV